MIMTEIACCNIIQINLTKNQKVVCDLRRGLNVQNQV